MAVVARTSVSFRLRRWCGPRQPSRPSAHLRSRRGGADFNDRGSAPGIHRPVTARVDDALVRAARRRRRRHHDVDDPPTARPGQPGPTVSRWQGPPARRTAAGPTTSPMADPSTSPVRRRPERRRPGRQAGSRNPHGGCCRVASIDLPADVAAVRGVNGGRCVGHRRGGRC